MATKIQVDLPKAMSASNDCLPHAAMNLGRGQGIGLRPITEAVKRLVIDEQYGSFVLYRLDATGGFVGDSWHGTLDDAIWQVKKEFGVDVPRAATDATPGVSDGGGPSHE